MTKLLTENLFLLEFLVDDLQMNARCDCQTPPGELCVTFQFLDNAPLEIAESDFCPRGNGPEIDNTKSGKSCLFSMTPQRISSSLNEFGVFISVCKKMQPGWAPDKINMANADISISNLFRELVNSVEMNQGKSPAAKTLKDEFELFDEMGCCIGKISIYIRMSCFGKLIVTQFQMNLEDKTVLFKDKEGQSLYRYKKSKKKTGSCAPTCPRAPCPPPRNDSTGGKSSMNGCPSMGGSIGPNRFPPPGGMMGQPSAMMGTTPGMVLGGAPPMAPPSSGFGFGNCPGGQRIPGGMSPIMSNGRLGGGGGSLPFAIDNNAVNAPLGLKGNGENLYGMRNDIMGLGNYPGNNPYVQLGNGSIQEFFNLGNNSVNDIYRVGKPCLDDNPLFSMSFNNQFCNQGFSPLSSMLSPTPPLPPPPPQQIYDGFRMTAGDDECPCSGCGDSAPQVGEISNNPPPCGEDPFHEFGATYGLNSLTIRIIKNKGPPAECAVDPLTKKTTCSL